MRSFWVGFQNDDDYLPLHPLFDFRRKLWVCKSSQTRGFMSKSIARKMRFFSAERPGANLPFLPNNLITPLSFLFVKDPICSPNSSTTIMAIHVKVGTKTSPRIRKPLRLVWRFSPLGQKCRNVSFCFSIH